VLGGDPFLLLCFSGRDSWYASIPLFPQSSADVSLQWRGAFHSYEGFPFLCQLRMLRRFVWTQTRSRW